VSGTLASPVAGRLEGEVVGDEAGLGCMFLVMVRILTEEMRLANDKP